MLHAFAYSAVNFGYFNNSRIPRIYANLKFGGADLLGVSNSHINEDLSF